MVKITLDEIIKVIEAKNPRDWIVSSWEETNNTWPYGRSDWDEYHFTQYKSKFGNFEVSVAKIKDEHTSRYVEPYTDEVSHDTTTAYKYQLKLKEGKRTLAKFWGGKAMKAYNLILRKIREYNKKEKESSIKKFKRAIR